MTDEWGPAISGFADWLDGSGRSEATSGTHVKHVTWLAATAPAGPWDLRAADLGAWLDGAHWALRTRRNVLGSIRLFYASATSQGLCTWPPTAGVAAGPHATRARSGPDRQPVAPAWAATVDEHLVWLAASGASSGSVELRRHWLAMVAREVGCGPWEVREQQLAEFLGSRPWAPETRKSARTAVRMFYRWAHDHELVDVDPARRLPPIRIPATVPNPCPDDVIAAALELAKPHERLMLLLGAMVGLRCVEIAKVHARDVVQRPDGVWLHVVGKGGKARSIPVGSPLAEELTAFAAGLSPGLPRRYAGDREPSGYLFVGRTDGHVSAAHVSKMLKRLLGPGWSAHKLRHRFATVAYAQRGDLLAVQQLLGHSKPETTQRYTALPGDALRTAVAGIGVAS